MNRLSEGEIQSLTRKYLLENRFRLVSRTLDGQLLRYRVKVTHPPQYKLPDQVAIRPPFVLVFEEKVRYSALFEQRDKDGMSDVDKLDAFLNNKRALSEFKGLTRQVGLPLERTRIIGAFASMKPTTNDTYVLPRNATFVGIETTSNGFSVGLVQDGGVPGLFEINQCKLVL